MLAEVRKFPCLPEIFALQSPYKQKTKTRPIAAKFTQNNDLLCARRGLQHENFKNKKIFSVHQRYIENCFYNDCP